MLHCIPHYSLHISRWTARRFNSLWAALITATAVIIPDVRFQFSLYEVNNKVWRTIYISFFFIPEWKHPVVGILVIKITPVVISNFGLRDRYFQYNTNVFVDPMGKLLKTQPTILFIIAGSNLHVTKKED